MQRAPPSEAGRPRDLERRPWHQNQKARPVGSYQIVLATENTTATGVSGNVQIGMVARGVENHFRAANAHRLVMAPIAAVGRPSRKQIDTGITGCNDNRQRPPHGLQTPTAAKDALKNLKAAT